MKEFTIYHNPRCRKSRETLALLKEEGIEPKIVLYLENPPSLDELTELAKLLEMRPIEFTRTKEPEFKAMALDPKTISDEKTLEILVNHPKLIERPIVVKNGKEAVLGRPPENVEELI